MIAHVLKGNKGFSLIELLLVVIIIAIIAGLSMMSTTLIRRERLRASTQTLLADLQKIRTDAMTSGSIVSSSSGTLNSVAGSGIRFSSPTSYVLFKFNDTDNDYVDDGAGEEAVSLTQTVNSSEQITLTVNPPSPIATNVIIFDHFGFPRYSVAPSIWQMLPYTVIKLSYQGVVQIRCISIDTNSIREGLWDGATCKTL